MPKDSSKCSKKINNRQQLQKKKKNHRILNQINQKQQIHGHKQNLAITTVRHQLQQYMDTSKSNDNTEKLTK